MRISLKIIFLIGVSVFILPWKAHSAGPLDPVKLGSWTVNIGIGPGSTYFGNGSGFGPAEKVSFETGQWDAGPGIITLGGEFTLSTFWHTYNPGHHETWTNFFFAARSAYHYGWDVEGLDTYGGIPLGIAFCAHTWDAKGGSSGYTPVYPYFGFFFGASYFFTRKFGVNGEVGFNSTHANMGVIFRLK